MLKPATAKDIQAIHKLIDQAAQSNKVLPRSPEEIAQVLNCFLVYKKRNKVIGCVALEVYSVRLAEIRSLVVHPEYQGQGIGKQLVTACIDQAKAQNIDKLLSVTDRDDLFEKLGFEKCLGGQYPMFLRPHLL